MFNADRLLMDLIGGGLMGGGMGRKRYRYRHGRGMGGAIGRTVMSPQGLTILGGLAVAAYEHFKGKQGNEGAGPAVPATHQAPGQGAPALPAEAGGAPGGGLLPATPPPFVPPAAGGSSGPAVAGEADATADDQRARLLITAMVSAAKADGVIDPQERSRILGRLAEQGASEEERAFLEEEMARPLDVDRVVSQVHDPVRAAEVYAASLLAIDPDTPAERAYLAMVAARLGLDPEVVRGVESELDTAGA